MIARKPVKDLIEPEGSSVMVDDESDAYRVEPELDTQPYGETLDIRDLLLDETD